MTYAITNDKNEIIWAFADKEDFINKSIKLFKECLDEDFIDEETEIKKLGFSLADNGEIIIDDNCYNSCIRFWEEYGGQFNRCKVWK